MREYREGRSSECSEGAQMHVEEWQAVGVCSVSEEHGS